MKLATKALALSVMLGACSKEEKKTETSGQGLRATIVGLDLSLLMLDLQLQVQRSLTPKVLTPIQRVMELSNDVFNCSWSKMVYL
jgi:hypothetical protein